MADEKKISGFKKFTEMKSEKKELEEAKLDSAPSTDSDRPGNPNTPNTSKKIEKMPSRKGIIPKEQNVDLENKIGDEEKSNEDKDTQVKLYGKVAKFPKKTKASKAYNFLENVKISKNSIWYILIEKQDNELQMVKYNNKKGFDMAKFVLELKNFYLNQYSKDQNMIKLIESIEVGGAEEFSSIKNIPNIDIAVGKKLISKITEDLIKLLSK
jgi:hypothetical protein